MFFFFFFHHTDKYTQWRPSIFIKILKENSFDGSPFMCFHFVDACSGTVSPIVLGDDLCQMTGGGHQRLKWQVSRERGPHLVMQKGAAREFNTGIVHTHTHTHTHTQTATLRCCPANRNRTSLLLTSQTLSIERRRPMQEYKRDRSFSNTNTHSSTGSAAPSPSLCYTLTPSHSVIIAQWGFSAQTTVMSYDKARGGRQAQ